MDPLSPNTVWYTGNNEQFDKFSTLHVGQGNDQLGPGLYFTTSRETAENYGDNVYVCNIKWDRVLDPYDDVDLELMDFLLDQIEWSEEWDWESSRQARDTFSRMTNLGMISQLATSFRFYSDNEYKLIKFISDYGYTGFVVGAGSTINQEREDKEKWAVIWDDDAIVIRERLGRSDDMNGDNGELIKEELTKTEVKDIVKAEALKVLKAEMKKMVEEELKKVLKERDIKNQVGDISKEILKKLYKDLSIHHTYVIDRVNF